MSQNEEYNKGEVVDEATVLAVAKREARIAAKEAVSADLGAKEWPEDVWNFVRRVKAVRGIEQLTRPQLKAVYVAFARTIASLTTGAARERFTGSGREEHWEWFLHFWDQVKFPMGAGPLLVAFTKAKTSPIAVPDAESENYALLVSTAYYLQLMQGDKTIYLPVDLVGLLFQKTKSYGAMLVKLLIKDGYLLEVKAHRFTERKAKEFRFCFDRLSGSGPISAASIN